MRRIWSRIFLVVLCLALLALLDVLVDGPYMKELHDLTLRFRGSSNQRLIDVPRSLQAGSVVLWQDVPIYAEHSH